MSDKFAPGRKLNPDGRGATLFGSSWMMAGPSSFLKGDGVGNGSLP